MPETKTKSLSPSVEQPSSIGLASAILSGLALVTVALMLVVLFGFLYTFLVRSEVKASYVPLASVAVAELLALVNFALLFPYVLYTFEVMRAETLVSGIMRRARKEIRAATRKRHVLQRRRALLTCME